MGLAHRDRELGFPASVQLAEAGIAVALRMALDVLVPEDRQRDVLALELPVDRARPDAGDLASCRRRQTAWPRARHRSAASGSGQLSPAVWKRLSVTRTVDAATPIRRAISRIGTAPTNFNRRTSRTWRMVVLSAGIGSLLWKPKERT